MGIRLIYRPIFIDLSNKKKFDYYKNIIDNKKTRMSLNWAKIKAKL